MLPIFFLLKDPRKDILTLTMVASGLTNMQIIYVEFFNGNKFRPTLLIGRIFQLRFINLMPMIFSNLNIAWWWNLCYIDVLTVKIL